jgi:hypothetical protein
VKKSKISVHTKRGRPATGFDPAVTTRLPEELIAAIDKWAERMELNRSQAIRRLVELGLKKGLH